MKQGMHKTGKYYNGYKDLLTVFYHFPPRHQGSSVPVDISERADSSKETWIKSEHGKN